MANNIDPVIVVKLAEFRQRLRWLWLIHAVCTAAVTFFSVVALVTTVDWLFVMPDWLRWALASLIYLGTAIVLCRNGRKLFARLGDKESAQRIESLRPELREQLLAAVELGKNQEAQVDSSAFRQLIQKQVAVRMRDLEVKSLLPGSLVKPSLRLGVILAGVFCGLFFLPHTPFRLLIARALLPGANLARFSQTEIELITPAQAEGVVPRGDLIPIVAALAGKPERHPEVEFKNSDGPWNRLSMTQTKPGQFSASLPVSGDPIEYRVIAGDAVTRRYRLTPKPRPHVVRFEKIYHYPRYAHLDPIKTSDDNGDIAGLEDSEVELRLKLDQPVRLAELEIVSGRNSTNVLPLTDSINGMLQTRITLTEKQTYRVRLVSQETGFENKFSPQYEIRPIPDLPPIVQISAPDQDIAAAPDEWIVVQGKATDDLPFAAVSQWVQKNNEGWRELPLSNISKTNVSIQTKWDLIDLNLTAGDHVQTKFSATDLKGARTESPLIHVTILSSTLDGKRMRVVQEHRRIAASLKQLRIAAEGVAGSFDDAVQNLRTDDLGLQGRQIALKLASQTAALDLRIGEALGLIKAALPNSRGGAESAALAAVGNALIATREDGLALIEPALSDTRLPSESILKSGVRALLEAGHISDWYRDASNGEEMGFVVESLWSLMEEQQRLLAQCAKDQPEIREQIRRRETAATRSVVLIEQVLTNVWTAIPDQFANRLRSSKEQIAAARLSFQNQLQEGGSVTTNQITNCRAALEHALGDCLALSEESSKATGTIFNGPESLLQAGLRPRKIFARKIDAFADLEELRPDGDLSHLAELRKVAAALRGGPDNFAFSSLDALKIVRVAHTLNELTGDLEDLAQAEKWELHEIKGRTETPRNWIWSKRIFQDLPDQLRFMSNVVSTRLAQWGTNSAFREVQAEMDQRFDLGRPARSVAPEMDALVAILKQTTVELSTDLNSARELLALSAPDLSARIQSLSGRIEELQIATQAALSHFSDREIIRNLHETQQELNNEIDRVCSAIRQDGSSQNIASNEGRDHARDVDDGLTLLREPPILAEAALRAAVGARSETEQSRSLLFGVAQQEKLARTLHRLDEHFQDLQKGVPETTRSELRQNEEELGVKSELDQIYQKSNLFREGVRSPEGLMSELEQELTNNVIMRRELRSISKNILASSEDILFESASNEQSISRQLSDLSKRLASQQQILKEEAKGLSDEVRSIGTTEVPSLSKGIKRESVSIAVGMDGVASMLKSAADQIKIEIGQPPQESASRLKTAAQEIENAARKLGVANRDFAIVKSAAQKSEQTSSATLKESQAALRNSRMNLENTEIEIRRIKAQQERLNTEELQHKLEQAEAANLVAQTQARDALAAAEIAANSAKTAEEASLRIAKLDQDTQKMIEKTTQLARAIRNQSETLEIVARDMGADLSKIAAAEEPIEKKVEVVMADLSRALRHAGRLAVASLLEEKQQAPDLSEKLKATVASTQELISKSIPTAQQSIHQASLPSMAHPAVEEVEKRLKEASMRLSELRALSFLTENSRLKRDREDNQRSEAESKWLARALDQLESSRQDSQANAQANAEIEAAMHSALQCRRTSMAIKRAVAANTQNQRKSILDQKNSAREPDQGPNSQTADARNQEWGKLPRKLVEDLFQAARDPVSPEYPAMVDSYFKAIAEKAKQAAP